MARIDLPVLSARGMAAHHNGTGDGVARRGVAVERARDAYRDVPILQEPTWANEIAAYFYLGGISSGAAILGSLATLLGGPERQMLARTAHYVAFAAMLPCPALLIADLGKPTRFHHMLRIFKPSSPMNFGAWVLTVDGGTTALVALRALAGEVELPLIGGALRLLPEAPLAALNLPPALALGGYTGVLIGTTGVPLWYTSPLLGALFMASALSTGAAASSLASSLAGREQPGDHRATTPIERTVGMAEIALAVGYLATTGKHARPLLRGGTGLMLAGGVAVSGLALALERASEGMGEGGAPLRRAAAGLTLAGGALLRWSIVMAGKKSSRDRQDTLEAMSPSARAPGWGNRLSRGTGRRG